MGKVVAKDELIGQVVGGRYEIIRLIGKGGMGAIYEVRNTRLGRSFAMKTLIGEAADDVEVLARFRREADVVARIKHPHIVEVIDWESLADGSPCIILEYLAGEDLAHRIRDCGAMPWMFIAKVGDQILSALQVAHAANVIHRDLKPQNIFLALDDTSEERAKLLDFGISKIRDSRTLVTTDTRLLGTPAYMAPEQAESRPHDVGPATDLWAMGTILYEMATATMAFDGDSLPAVLYKICSKDVDPIEAKRPDTPPAFAQLIRDVLERDVGRRISDASVMRQHLRDALAKVAPDVRYSERVIRPRAPTPLPTAPTPRAKRYTGATDETVSSNHDLGTAKTVHSGSHPLVDTPTSAVGQVSMTQPPARRVGPIAIATFAIAAAMVVLAIVIVSRKSEPTDDGPARGVSEPRLVEPKPQPPPADAGGVVEVDAAVARPAPLPESPPIAKPAARPKVEPPKPAARPKVEPAKPAIDPPKLVDPPKPPKPADPKAARCGQHVKGTTAWNLCMYDDGGGN